MPITHRFTSPKADSTDATLVNPSNWNAAHVYALGFLYAPDYNFTPLTATASLVAGSNDITFTTLPDGLAVGNSLYISGGGGTGGDEAVAITAINTNTVTVTCGGTHTGAWQIQSASGGIQEAITASIQGGIVLLYGGSTNIYATINLLNNVRITGGTMIDIYAASYDIGTKLVPQVAGMTVFNLYNVAGCVFENFTVFNANPQLAGYSFYEAHGSVNNAWRYIQTVNDWYAIFQETDAGGGAFIDHCRFAENQHAAINTDNATADGAGAIITNNQFVSTSYSFAAIAIRNGGGTLVHGNGFHCYSSYGVFHQPRGATSQLQIVDNTFDGVFGIGIYSGPLSGVFDHTHIKGNIFSNFVNDGSGTFHGVSGYIGIHIANTFCQHGVISGNTFQPWYTTGNTSHILASILMQGVDWLINSNVFNNGAIGIQVAGATIVTIGTDNRMNNVVDYNLYLASASGGYHVSLNMPCSLPYAILTSITCEDGSMVFCSDGKVTSGADNTLTSTGTGCLAVKCNGTWRAFLAQN